MESAANGVAVREDSPSLTKFVYVLSGAWAVYSICTWLLYYFLLGNNSRSDRWRNLESFYPARVLLFAFVMCGVVLFYRPVLRIMAGRSHTAKNRGVLRNVLFGLLTGVVASMIAFPLVRHFREIRALTWRSSRWRLRLPIGVCRRCPRR